ncbi:hypothetical protein A3Q56_02977, partial [Intoshia linei]
YLDKYEKGDVKNLLDNEAQVKDDIVFSSDATFDSSDDFDTSFIDDDSMSIDEISQKKNIYNDEREKLGEYHSVKCRLKKLTKTVENMKKMDVFSQSVVYDSSYVADSFVVNDDEISDSPKYNFVNKMKKQKSKKKRKRNRILNFNDSDT